MSKYDYCTHLSATYDSAAFMRDNGMTPKQVYASGPIRFSLGKGLTPVTVKKAINNVFFNPAFALPTGQIGERVMDVCMNPRKYEPLR